jgi:uncharacterized membrane protein YhhN
MPTLARLALILGITGASLLSFDSEFRNYGYFPFLISAIFSCMILWRKEKNLFALNAVFAAININGIYQFFII